MKKHLIKISKIMSNTHSQKDMENLLATLLTEKEQHDVALRIEILQMLEKGIAQREIAKMLGVGIATVTRGSAAYKSAPTSVTNLLS